MTHTKFKSPTMVELMSKLVVRVMAHEESLKKVPMPRHEVLIRQELSTLYGILMLISDDSTWVAKNVEHQRAAAKILMARGDRVA